MGKVRRLSSPYINVRVSRRLLVNIKTADKGKYYRAFRQYDIDTAKGVQELYSLLTKREYDELSRFAGMFG